jgi:GR25 family glycosyltransferase involved in LPS biosynthesis
VNDSSTHRSLTRVAYSAAIRAGRFVPKPRCSAFSGAGEPHRIGAIHVINLDRQPERWEQMVYELDAQRDAHGSSLCHLVNRLAAVDGRTIRGTPPTGLVTPYYSLADQLFVDPHPLLEDRAMTDGWQIEMTRQEVAVALSHIAVWQRVAACECRYALVLEDDVFFRWGLAYSLTRAWRELTTTTQHAPPCDVLYLSYQEARLGVRRVPVSRSLFRPLSGLWQLSGYVLSSRGARRLLDSLPVRGPVDLWINHQFKALDVFALNRPLIRQRADVASVNRHSVLPVLSQVGVLTKERPAVVKPKVLPGPVFAFGDQGSGLTALATALSMLGYRCCSDVAALPTDERERLMRRKRGRVFSAYVNVGGFTQEEYLALARSYPNAKFLVISGHACPHELSSVADRVRMLDPFEDDRWGPLCDLLGLPHPNDAYPVCQDLGQRCLRNTRRDDWPASKRAVALRHDISPWIVPGSDWRGIELAEQSFTRRATVRRAVGLAGGRAKLDTTSWMVRNDTFPSNLALFSPSNFATRGDGSIRLTFRRERASVREYTSASVCTRGAYLYGRFAAELRPPATNGLITGIFLHRNSPRQEIDIEILGRDPRKMLVNVYYNPGSDGARIEYGYRGTPVLVDLGFDASQGFHRYEIDWSPSSIRWFVDGKLVHKRANWSPTPVPHLPLQFNVNLWHSRSEELAGRLAVADLPAETEIRGIELHAAPDVRYHAQPENGDTSRVA